MLFDALIARFRAADKQTRLDALLDYSRKLPALPPEWQADAERDAHRIPECQTPVFLWIEVRDQAVHLHAEVPRESPTVRGYVALLQRQLDGRSPAEVAEVPDDLLERLGLAETLGMMRTQGLTAILGRVKRGVARAAMDSV